MHDLIARANKYAKSAGRTGAGQYRAAQSNERLSQWLIWVSTALTAVVGTSIFKGWAATWTIAFGVTAIIAAALGAMQRMSKLDERAVKHKVAGAEYGRLRRRADLLRLRLEGGDVDRMTGLAELEKLGEDLSALAMQMRALPDRIYDPAAAEFDSTHPEYSIITPGHAGGVVFRSDGTTIQYLVVQSKRVPSSWVLPKGHIEAGESAEQAARREVMEEAGVEAYVKDALDTVEFSAPNGRVRAQFFLMEMVREGPPGEGRERQWQNFDETMDTLQFKEAQRLICQAHAMLQDTRSRMATEVSTSSATRD